MGTQEWPPDSVGVIPCRSGPRAWSVFLSWEIFGKQSDMPTLFKFVCFWSVRPGSAEIVPLGRLLFAALCTPNLEPLIQHKAKQISGQQAIPLPNARRALR